MCYNNDMYTYTYTNYDINNFYKILYNLLLQQNKNEIVILCIGSTKSSGDSLAPIIGSNLSKYNLNKYNCYVYGTLENPVNAINLSDKLKYIKKVHKNFILIAIDACLGEETENIGDVNIHKGSIEPGSALRENSSTIGDISITGIVNVRSKYGMNFMNVSNSNMLYVINESNFISEGMILTLKKLHKRKYFNKILKYCKGDKINAN